RRAHAVRVAREDEPMQFLDRPAVIDEPACEPVEELRMRGLLAHDSEVAGCADQSFPEVMLPDAVHDDARGERIVRAGEPPGQRQPAQARALWDREVRLGSSDYLGDRRRDLRTGRGG